MFKSVVKILSVVIALTPFGYAAKAGPGSPRSIPLPSIESVTVETKVIVIAGQDIGFASPTIRLANHAPRVKSFSANQVVVHIVH